jgi:peptidylprolyl isomerase
MARFLLLLAAATIGVPVVAETTPEPRKSEAQAAKPATPRKEPGNGKAAENAKAADANQWVKQGVQFEDIEALLKLLPFEQRESVLADDKAFEHFVKLEAQNRAVVAAARANKVEDDPLVQTVMRRGAERVLAEIYLNQVIRTNLPAGFPSEEQLRGYYDQNKSKFEAPERLHLWQIFLPLTKDAKADEVAATQKKADALAKALQQGKQDFAAAASENSRHQASRVNGGYMGLLKVADLIPEVRAVVPGLKIDAISDPVRSDAGFHIVKRGATVAAQPLAYEDIKAEVRQLLLRDAVTKIREAALKKITDTYPVNYEADSIAVWRKKLKSADTSGKASDKPAAGGGQAQGEGSPTKAGSGQ